jgi:quinoprotein glucose dehydrogenase
MRFVGTKNKWIVAFVAMVFISTILTPSAQEEGTQNGEWPSYGGDLAHTRYSPLDQITGDNFNELEVAWSFRTDNFGPTPEFSLQSTPLMVNGVVYTVAGTRRAAVALDAATGEILWFHRYEEGERGDAAPRRLSGRGLAYVDDGADGKIFYVTPGYHLIGLNALTGHRVTDFGSDGIVDLKTELDQDVDPVTGEIGLHAAPVAVGNTIVIGAAHLPGGSPKSMRNTKGFIRGYDTTTGDRKWIFHTIPQGDEYGNDTWEGDSWRYTGNTGVWGQMTIDPELGMAYLPVEMPTNDYYGGHRLGDNLFSDSLVALDLETGERVWHFQTTHHDVWDWDLPAAPVLTDITVDGRAIKAVSLPTKQSWLYVFDRETGEPVWPIEEIPVPPSDIPGEVLSPTQPHPTKPPAFDQQGIGPDDLIDFTPELRERALEVLNKFRYGRSIFTPPSVGTADGTYGTLQVPASTGGVNWPGGSFDPETGIFYQYSKTEITNLGLVNDPDRSDMNFIRGRPEGVSARQEALNIEGIPIIKPPWGRISAIDLNRGEILWQTPHGETADNIRNHRLLEGVEVPRTGRPGRVGTLITKTLVIAGDGGTFTNEEGVSGAMLRAYDKMTGVERGAVFIPARQSGSPMTYTIDGKQHLVVAVSGGGYGGELVAFRLP